MNAPWWQAPCQPLDHVARQKATQRQARLTKPTGALGRLEQLAIDLAALQGRECPHLEQPWIAVFAGDHGVVEEGVSAYPQAVTRQMLHNFVAGGAAISVLAHQLHARLEVVDLGMAGDPEPLGGVHSYRLGPGTANFTREPAMSAEQCAAALAAGRASVERARQAHAGLFIGGEMGIGNTTAAAALGCALLDLPALALTGPGTGLNEAGVAPPGPMARSVRMARPVVRMAPVVGLPPVCVPTRTTSRSPAGRSSWSSRRPPRTSSRAFPPARCPRRSSCARRSRSRASSARTAR